MADFETPSHAAEPPGPDHPAIDDLRAAELAHFRVLDTAPEAEYDRVAAMAAECFEAPIAMVSLIDRDRVWFKARVGLDITEAARSTTFCHHTVMQNDPLVVCDARLDARFADNPFVAPPCNGLRFYAGAPVISSRGIPLGTVCIFDVEPRQAPTARELAVLKGLARLVTDRLEARPVERMRRMAAELAKTSSDAIVATDAAGIITTWNLAAERIFGWRADEAVGRGLDLIVPPRFSAFHAEGFRSLIAERREPRQTTTADLWGLHRDGHEVPVELSLALMRDEDDFGVGAIIRDVSVRRRQEVHLRWLAHYDPLTGTPNRATLTDDLGRLLARGEAEGDGHFTVALLDLDGFKDVNDTLGHSTGDTLLQRVAEKLVDSLGIDGSVYRLGGDEFALVLPNTGGGDAARRVLAQAQEAIARPFDLDGVSIDVEASVGYALSPIDGNSVEELVSNADLALYRAKRGRSGQPCRFTADLRADVTRRRTLDGELRAALQTGEFELYWQPQLDYANERWMGAEALLRWNHPTRGLLAPDAFMEILEASTLSGAVGAWVMRDACRQAAAWRRRGIGFERISVNLFVTQLRRPQFRDEVASLLAEFELPGHALELEITEKIALTLDETPLHTLHGLHDLGVKLAFDDFGTGYASLSALKRYPIDRLKIDRSFVRDLPHDESDAAIVSSIIAISTALGLEVVAEGVETEVQRDHLIRRGCLAGQGFLHARPMPVREIERLVGLRPAAE